MTNDLYGTAAVATSNGRDPASSQVYGASLTLVAGTAVPFDLKPLANLHRINDVQGIFADNSAGTAALRISTRAGQNIIVPPGSQCMMPLHLSADNVVTFSGAGNVPVELLNFPCPAAVWATASNAFPVTGSGYVQTSDVALDGLITSKGFPVLETGLTSGDTVRTKRFGNAFAGSITAAGTTTVITGAPSSFVTGIYCNPYGLFSTVAAIASISVQFSTMGQIFTRQFYINTGSAVENVIIQDGPFYIECGDLVGNLAGDNVTVTLSVPGGGTITGGINYTVFGGTTAQA